MVSVLLGNLIHPEYCWVGRGHGRRGVCPTWVSWTDRLACCVLLSRSRTGQRTTATAETWGLYFSGRWIVKATLDYLSATHDLKAATEVILSGNSAGGFGVYSNVDFFQGYLPQAKVVGAPIAGYEFYACVFGTFRLCRLSPSPRLSRNDAIIMGN
jgi:hypothetical protein